MKKLILILLAVFFLTTSAYADMLDDLKEYRAQQEAEKITIEEDEYLGPTLEDIKSMAYATHSNLTEEQLRKGLKYNLKDLAGAYLYAEKTYNVNACIKAAQDALESDWGRHCFKENNISGFFTDAQFWSKEECIYFTSERLEKWYIQPPHEGCYHENCEIGKFYNGRTIYDVTIHYCPADDDGINYEYGDLVCEIAYNIYYEALK